MDHIRNLLSPTTAIDGYSPQYIVAGDIHRWITSPIYCHRQRPSMDTPHNLLWQRCPSMDYIPNLLSPILVIDGYSPQSIVAGNVYRLLPSSKLLSPTMSTGGHGSPSAVVGNVYRSTQVQRILLSTARYIWCDSILRRLP